METAVQGLNLHQEGNRTTWSKTVSQAVVIVEGDNTAGQVCVNNGWYAYTATEDKVVIKNERGQTVWTFDNSDLGWDQFANSQI